MGKDKETKKKRCALGNNETDMRVEEHGERPQRLRRRASAVVNDAHLWCVIAREPLLLHLAYWLASLPVALVAITRDRQADATLRGWLTLYAAYALFQALLVLARLACLSPVAPETVPALEPVEGRDGRDAREEGDIDVELGEPGAAQAWTDGWDSAEERRDFRRHLLEAALGSDCYFGAFGLVWFAMGLGLVGSSSWLELLGPGASPAHRYGFVLLAAYALRLALQALFFLLCLLLLACPLLDCCYCCCRTRCCHRWRDGCGDRLARFVSAAGLHGHMGSAGRVDTALARLRPFVFEPHPTAGEEQQQQQGEYEAPVCAICLEPFAAGDALRLLRCAHCFHAACVERALLADPHPRGPRCPICRFLA